MREETTLETISQGMKSLSLMQAKLKLILNSYEELNDREVYALIEEISLFLFSACDDLRYAIKDVVNSNLQI